jgi:hypothetical protein
MGAGLSYFRNADLGRKLRSALVAGRADFDEEEPAH